MGRQIHGDAGLFEKNYFGKFQGIFIESSLSLSIERYSSRSYGLHLFFQMKVITSPVILLNVTKVEATRLFGG